MATILNHPLILFLITLIISFMGSVQPGVVNVMASRLVLTHGRKYALTYSIAASMPEVMYAFIAAYYVGTLNINDALQRIITAFAGLVLVAFGIILLCYPPKIEVAKERFHHPALKGLLLSVTNPQLIIFWSGMIIVYKQYGIDLQGSIIAIALFSLGAAVGAFLLLVGYMKLADHFLNDLHEGKIVLLNKISAYVLIWIGIIATLSLLL